MHPCPCVTKFGAGYVRSCLCTGSIWPLPCLGETGSGCAGLILQYPLAVTFSHCSQGPAVTAAQGGSLDLLISALQALACLSLRGAPGLFPLAPHGFWVLKAGLSVVHGQTLSQAGEEHSMSLRGSGPRKTERESKGLESQEHPPGTNAPWPAGALPGYSPSLSVEEALEAGREEERGEVVSGTGSEALPAGLLTLSRGLWRW